MALVGKLDGTAHKWKPCSLLHPCPKHKAPQKLSLHLQSIAFDADLWLHALHHEVMECIPSVLCGLNCL
jgi:hypothetical protein